MTLAARSRKWGRIANGAVLELFIYAAVGILVGMLYDSGYSLNA